MVTQLGLLVIRGVRIYAGFGPITKIIKFPAVGKVVISRGSCTLGFRSVRWTGRVESVRVDHSLAPVSSSRN